MHLLRLPAFGATGVAGRDLTATMELLVGSWSWLVDVGKQTYFSPMYGTVFKVLPYFLL